MAGVVLGAAALLLLTGCDGSDPQDLEEFFEGARDAVDQVEDVVDDLQEAGEDPVNRPAPPPVEPLSELRGETEFSDTGEQLYAEQALYSDSDLDAITEHYTDLYGEPTRTEEAFTAWNDPDESRSVELTHSPESGTVTVVILYPKVD